MCRTTGDGRTRAWGLPLMLTLAMLACSSARDESAAPASADFAAPPSLRATLVLAPAALEIGEVTVAQLAVVTPPGVRVLPVAPVELPGLWLLGVRSLPLQVDDERWIHRTEFRIRPRDVGTHTWPAMTVRVERPDGTVEELALEPRAFDVTSVRERFAERDEPFGLETLGEAEASGASFDAGLATGFALGALAGLSGLWLRRVVTRRREAKGARARAAGDQPAISLGAWSKRELGNVLDALEEDPRGAASTGAHLLRVYMSRRYGGDTEAATTEELEVRPPRLAQRALWPDFIRILHNFDDVRFRPSGATGEAEHRARTRRAIEDSLRLVAASRPDGGRTAR